MKKTYIIKGYITLWSKIKIEPQEERIEEEEHLSWIQETKNKTHLEIRANRLLQFCLLNLAIKINKPTNKNTQTT